ncbi:MAG: PilN domain-containing protein [Bacillota bacterium]|nr:PilN domain-containing protein [Bacillota bacterium]
MYDINLLQKKKKQSKYSFITDRVKILLACMVGAAFILAASTGIVMLLDSNYKKDNDQLNKHIATMSSINKVKQDLSQKQAKSARMTAFAKAVSAYTQANTQLFDSISKTMPDNIFFLNYSLSADGDINISGKSKDRESVAYFLYNLNQTGAFSDASIKSITSNSSSNNGKAAEITDYSFTITLKIKK